MTDQKKTDATELNTEDLDKVQGGLTTSGAVDGFVNPAASQIKPRLTDSDLTSVRKDLIEGRATLKDGTKIRY